MRNLHKISMLGGGPTLQTFLKKSPVQIPAMRLQLKSVFIFPIISLWKLSYHSNQSTYATETKTQNKNKISFVEAHAMNISAKYPPFSF